MPAILPLTTPAPQSTSALGAAAAAPGAGASLPILHTGNSPREMPQTSSSSLSTTEVQRAITQNTGSVLSALGITQNSAANSGPEGTNAPSQTQTQTAPSTVETSVTRQRGFGTPNSENLDDLFEETPQQGHSREKRDTSTGTTETCSYSKEGNTETKSYTVDETFDSSMAKTKCDEWLKQNKDDLGNQCDVKAKAACDSALKKAIEKDGKGKCDELKTYITGSDYGLLSNANTGALGEIKTSAGICSSDASSSGASSGAGAGSSSGGASAPSALTSSSTSASAAPSASAPSALTSSSTSAAAAPTTAKSTTAAPTTTSASASTATTTADPGTEGINYTRMAQIIAGTLGGVSTVAGVLWGFYQYYLGGGRQREALGDAKMAAQVKQLGRVEEDTENTNLQKKADLDLKILKTLKLQKDLLNGPGNQTLTPGERQLLLNMNPLNDDPDNDSKDDPGKKNQQKLETQV